MILTTHALVGAALGKHVSNPWLIILIALPLHFFLDSFRHGEYLNRKSTFANTWWKVAIDLVAGLSIVGAYILLFHPTILIIRNILIGTFASMFPDLLTVLYWKLNFKLLYKLFQFHAWVHPYPKGDKRYDWNLRNGRNDIIFSILAIVLMLL
ncbi:MAG TPA: hypothetical protein VF817_02585 [Patescibacteria group bacterium]